MDGPDVPDPDKRATLKKLALAGGSVATAAHLAPRYSPVGRANAFACGGLCVGGIIVGGAAAASAGYLLGEWDPLEDDSPPEGLTAGALEESIYNTMETRKSSNKSTFVDQRNLIEMGFPETLYGDGKLAAIEALNAEKTESAVESDALAAKVKHETIVLRNFLRSWNEGVSEWENTVTVVQNHPDLSLSSMDAKGVVSGSGSADDVKVTYGSIGHEREHTLPNGETMTVKQIRLGTSNHYDHICDFDPIQIDSTSVIDYDGFTMPPEDMSCELATSSGQIEILNQAEWNNIWSALTEAASNAETGLQTWVSNTYGKVQAGTLDTEDLLTPSELAEMSGSESDFNQAVADLMALNIPIDLEREAEVNFPDSGTTLYGQLATTSEPEGGLPAGDTYDPSLYSMDFYFTYDVSQGHGTWSNYQTGIDGGNMTLTSEPYQGVVYQVKTVAGETVEVNSSEFTENADGNYTADLSGQLSNAITEVETVNIYSPEDSTEYVTIQIDEPFEIVTYRDSDGNEHDNADFSQSEPHDDTNYITEEEWDEREQRMLDLIEKYQESQDGGGSWIDKITNRGGMLGGGITLVIVAWIVGQLTG